MSATASSLNDYVAELSNGAPSAFVTQCWDEAVALVTDYIGSATVPQAIIDRACIEVGAELYNRKDAPNGIKQFTDFNGGAAVRVARDPMVAAYPLLGRYVGGGFA